MALQRAVWTIEQGPNQGDVIRVEHGTCRLIGRHLSENETAFASAEGHRVLDPTASAILDKHLQGKRAAKPRVEIKQASFQPQAFSRGADVILGDDAISRAHAMVFCDASGTGIIDLASTNGTFINGQRVSSALTTPGDVIGIGDSEMTVRMEESERVSP